MMIQRQWTDMPEVFESVANALLEAEGLTVDPRYEVSEYGESGYITIRTQDGRRFRLQLHEIV